MTEEPEDREEDVEEAVVLDPDSDDGLPDEFVWSPEGIIDRLFVRIYGVTESATGLALMLLAVVALAPLLFVFLTGIVVQPATGVFTVLSVLPGLFIVWYIWEVDPYEKEPLTVILVTYLFGCLLVVVPAFVNTALQGFLFGVPVVGMVLFFYLVVAPVEEFVKWLAVRVYAYHTDYFKTPTDGAVYGAAAGLGFATTESFTYLTLGISGQPMELTAIGRAAVGPGHVLWSSIAGYYLGLAKLNPEYRGPLILKGLIVAGVLHATYNVGGTAIPDYAETFAGPQEIVQAAMFLFLISIYAASAGYLFQKLWWHENRVKERVAESRRDAEATDR